MKNILLVIQKEFLLRIKSKVFILMTILGPVIIISFGMLIKFLSEKNQKEHNIVIYDETRIIGPFLKKTEGVNYHFIKREEIKSIKNSIIENKWDGLLYIPLPKSGNLSGIETNIIFYYNSTPSVSVIEKIRKDLNDRIRTLKLKESNISLEKINDAQTDITINLISFNDEKDSILLWQVKSVTGGVLGILIYMFILLYGAMVMKNVLNEKTSRVVEVILSSIKPFHLMMGKIISNALAGILQFSIWGIVSSFLFIIVKNSIGVIPVDIQLPTHAQEAKFAVNSVDDAFLKSIFEAIEIMDFSVIIGIGLLMFILGYLLYASIFAVIGAIIDSDNDAGQFTFPITLPLILSIYLGFSILENPNGQIAFWMSVFPFTSPVILMARIPFGVPKWEILLSIFILILTFLFIVWIGAKLYKRGIVTYGRSFSYKDIFKILMYIKNK